MAVSDIIVSLSHSTVPLIKDSLLTVFNMLSNHMSALNFDSRSAEIPNILHAAI